MNHVKFERYNAYKKSGVEWLSEVPAHWNEVRIKDIAFLERGKFTHRPRNDPQMYDGIHPFIQTGDVARANKYVTNYKQTLSDKGTNVSKQFKRGTLLMAIAANIGDVAIVDFDTYFPDSIVGFKPNKSHTDYLFYLFYATKSELNRVKVTSTQDNLNLERLNSIVKFLPSMIEQKAIATYLDTKTAQLDRKIDLLTQKATQYNKLKQSLINETVTHGLDKTVAMKDSGVEWIGKVPEHWEVRRGKDVFEQTKNKAGIESSSYDVLSLTLKGVIKRDLDNMKGKIPVSFDGYQITNPDNLVLCLFDMDVTPRIVGHVGQLGIITSAYTVLKGKYDTHMKYFLYYYLEQNRNGSLLSNSKTLRSTMTFDLFSQLRLPVPPLLEQKAIANYLDTKTAHIDLIIETINTQIDKLKELRKTLINDVVTGKIKVPQ